VISTILHLPHTICKFRNKKKTRYFGYAFLVHSLESDVIRITEVPVEIKVIVYIYSANLDNVC